MISIVPLGIFLFLAQPQNLPVFTGGTNPSFELIFNFIYHNELA